MFFLVIFSISIFSSAFAALPPACVGCEGESESNQSIVIGGILYPIIIENPAPVPSTLFGLLTSISENRLLIKAQEEENVVDEFGNQIRKETPQMFLFDCTQLTECTLVDTIVNPSPQLQDVFGTYSKMDWPYVVITAPESDVDIDNDGSLENEIGVAYFFDCSGNNCSLVDTISNPNPEEGARFGRFLSMSGTLVAISNPYEDIDGVQDAGQVYLFDCSGNSCSLVDSIPNPTPAQSEVFGTLSISGTNLAVGEINAEIDGVRRAGEVYLYDCSGNSCSLVDIIPNPDPKEGARFGNFISISGSLIAISHQQYMQVVYLYDCSGNSCSLVDTLQDPKNENEDTTGFEQFGFGTEGIVLVDHTLAVSDKMAGEDIDGSGIIENDETRFGEVYLYDCSSTGCSLFETLKNPTPEPSDSFGESFSMQSGNRILVGAPHAGQRGEVYFFNELVPPIEPEPAPDTIPPVIVTPNDRAVEATNSNGSIVTFSVSATDNIDGSISVSCSPTSGSMFSLGITTVTCSATDSSGNTATKSFTINVTFEEPSPTTTIPDIHG